MSTKVYGTLIIASSITVFVSHFSGTLVITTKKLNGKNYSMWFLAMDIWFLGQGCVDHLMQTVSDILTSNERVEVLHYVYSRRSEETRLMI